MNRLIKFFKKKISKLITMFLAFLIGIHLFLLDIGAKYFGVFQTSNIPINIILYPYLNNSSLTYMLNNRESLTANIGNILYKIQGYPWYGYESNFRNVQTVPKYFYDSADSNPNTPSINNIDSITTQPDLGYWDTIKYSDFLVDGMILGDFYRTGWTTRYVKTNNLTVTFNLTSPKNFDSVDFYFQNYKKQEIIGYLNRITIVDQNNQTITFNSQDLGYNETTQSVKGEVNNVWTLVTYRLPGYIENAKSITMQIISTNGYTSYYLEEILAYKSSRTGLTKLN